MKLRTKHVLIFLIISFTSIANVFAQEMSVEKVYKISGKAAKGGLQDYFVDEANNSIWLTYLIKNSSKKMVLEHYHFDLDLKFIEKQEETIEKEKARSKFRWYLGDGPQIIRMLQVGNNLNGQVVLKKGYLKVTYYNRGYTVSFVSEDKLKPKDEEGDKMSLVTYRTELPEFNPGLTWKPTANVSIAQGDATMVAHINNDIPFKDYSCMVVSLSSLEVSKRTPFSFDYLYYPIADAQLNNGDLAVVFAPLNESNVGAKLLKKNASEYPYSPMQNQLIYMRFSPESEVVEQLSIEVPTTSSHIQIRDNGDFVSLIGVSDTKNSLFTALPWLGREPGYTTPILKPTNFLFVKIVDGQVQFMSSPDLENVISNYVIPQGIRMKVPNPKNPDKFFNTSSGIQFSNAFSIQDKNFVAIQKDVQELLQFDASGNFEKGYFSSIDNGSVITWRSVFPGPNSTAYWLTMEQEAKKGKTRYLKIIQINPEKKDLGQVIIPGQKKYLIDPYSPAVSIKSGNELVILGAKKTKVYLAKVKL